MKQFIKKEEAEKLIHKMEKFKAELTEKVERRYDSLDKRIVNLEGEVLKHSDHLEKIKNGLIKEGDNPVI